MARIVKFHRKLYFLWIIILIVLIISSVLYIVFSHDAEKSRFLGGLLLGSLLSAIVSSIWTNRYEEKQLKSESKLRSFLTDRSLNAIKRIIEELRDSDPSNKQKTDLLEKLVDEYSSILDNSNLYEEDLNELYTIVNNIINSIEGPDYDANLNSIDNLIAQYKRKRS